MERLGKRSSDIVDSSDDARDRCDGATGSAIGHVHLWTITDQERKRFGQDAGSAKADEVARIRTEIYCLLEHYTPAYDKRICHLIDKWQASGDPGYNPTVRVEHRMAHRRHERDALVS